MHRSVICPYKCFALGECYHPPVSVIFVEDDNILYEQGNEQIPPQTDSVPTKCRILKWL